MKKNYFLSPLNLLLSIGVLLITFGCIGTFKEKENITFFGGKIKNPQDEYIFFLKNGKVLDSAKIDSNNKFSFYLDSIELGLYTFLHGSEHQYLYLEPKDSLLIYLNTWDFDESLIFSGTQAAKNNYLINLWLQQEKTEKKFKQNYKLNEEEFSKVIENEINKQLNSYHQLIENEGKESSPFFDKLAKTGIYFPYYYLKEYYPFKHRGALHLQSFPSLSNDFYNYRSDLNLNDESLKSYGPYMAYLRIYLYHKAYMTKFTDSEKNNVQLNFMEAVNEEITLESLKNDLLARSFWSSLTDTYMSDMEFQKIKKCFFENCTDKKIASEMNKSMQQKMHFKKGDILPSVIALNSNGDQITINDIVKNNNTVIYFWPKDLRLINDLEKKLEHLEKKYPDVLFIGIQRGKSKQDWVKFIESKKLSKENQFILSKNSDNYIWFDGNMDRTILINSNGNIQNGYLFFNDDNFDKHLKKFKKL